MSTPAPAPAAAAAASERGRGIAIVGRRREPAGEEAATLMAALGLEPLLRVEPGAVSDEPLLARLETLRSVGFAVLVLGADDANEGQLEIGFLLGALGRERVCVLTAGGGGVAHALEGLPHHPIDDDGMWRLLLARRMKQAGLEVDLNRAV